MNAALLFLRRDSCAPLAAGLLLAMLFVLGGCGLKGDLYLPEKSGTPVVITPASSSSSSSASSAAQP